MTIYEILKEYKSLYKKPHIPNSNEAIKVKESERYIKNNVNNICNNVNLNFNKQGFGLRKTDRNHGNIYKNSLLCRIFGLNDKTKENYFLIFVEFHAEGYVLVKIDRNQTKLEKEKNIYRGSKEEKEYTKNLNDNIAKFASKLHINYIENDNYMEISDLTSDASIFDFIKTRLLFIKPIYEELCDNGVDSLTKGELIKLFVPSIIFPPSNSFREVSVSDMEDYFEKNKNNFSSTVNSEKKVKENLLKAAIGKSGEIVINERLLDKLNKGLIKSFKWVSGNSKSVDANDSLGYDFEIINLDDTTTYYEVKTSTNDNLFDITVSLNEYNKMLELTNGKVSKYVIVIVNSKNLLVYLVDSELILTKNLLKPSEYKIKIDLKKIRY